MWILTLTCLLGAAPDWSNTFEASATASYLDRPNASVIVVSAGLKSDSQAVAERALVSALRSSGQTRLVMASESVAVLADDSDEAVVKKANPLPVDLIVVLRLFPGEPETAVATFYDKAAVALSAMSGLRGQPLTRKEGSSRQIAGRTAVAETIKAAERTGTQGKVDRAMNDSGKIEFAAGAMVDMRNGQVMSTWIVPYFQNKRLDGARFYDVVGRADLAKAYRGRMGAKVALIVSGSVVAVAGGLMALLTISPQCAVYDAAAYSCLQYRTPSLVVPGLVGMGIGLAALLTGTIIPADPLGPQKRFELAEEFNRKVDASKGTVSSREVEAPQVTFGFAPIPGGAGASLALTF